MNNARNEQWQEVADAREAQERRAETKYYWLPLKPKREVAWLAATIICALSALFLLYVASCGGTVCGR